jgi:hypothetical protein
MDAGPTGGSRRASASRCCTRSWRTCTPRSAARRTPLGPVVRAVGVLAGVVAGLVACAMLVDQVVLRTI